MKSNTRKASLETSRNPIARRVMSMTSYIGHLTTPQLRSRLSSKYKVIDEISVARIVFRRVCRNHSIVSGLSAFLIHIRMHIQNKKPRFLKWWEELAIIYNSSLDFDPKIFYRSQISSRVSLLYREIIRLMRFLWWGLFSDVFKETTVLSVDCQRFRSIWGSIFRTRSLSF
jgi:hypothetical protein